MKTFTIEELEELVSGAYQMMESFGPQFFNLSNIKVTDDNLEKLSCLLRVLSTWKLSIVGYEVCVSQCKAHCLENGIDPQDILYGIIPKE